MEIRTPAELEEHVAAVATTLTAPHADECVFCYVLRMLNSFGCDTTLRWARRWRDLQRPRATGLERRLSARGGFCDCEIFLNGWTLRDELRVPDEDGELTWPQDRPPCAGARSSQPCGNWVPWPRPGW
jgi:Protein of unknown function (DUF2695)